MEPQVNLVSVRDNLTFASNRQYQFPVNSVYDYLYGGVKYLALPHLKLNDNLKLHNFLKPTAPGEFNKGKPIQRSDNAIDLNPLAAGLPWASGILACRQSKHWHLSLDTTINFLQALATDDSNGIISKPGESIAEISQLELELNFKEGWAEFPIYLFSEANEQRKRPLAATFGRSTTLPPSFSGVHSAFISRMRPEFTSTSGSISPLERMIDETIAEMLQLDRGNGNSSGKDMIELMIQFCSRPAPPEKYATLEEFLLYRHEDAAVRKYDLGCVKFSLNPSVDLNSPGLAKYIRLFKDHVSIANDLGSWEKEKKVYDTGKVLYLINAVDTIKQLLSLPTYHAAVAVAQGLQLQIECAIDEEIQRLTDADSLKAEEWQFIDANIVCHVRECVGFHGHVSIWWRDY